MIVHDQLDDRLELEYHLGMEAGLHTVASLARDRGMSAYGVRRDTEAKWWRMVEDVARQMVANTQKLRGRKTIAYNKNYPDDVQSTASLEFPPTQEELSDER